MTADIIIFPRTEAGRELLLSSIQAAHSPDREPGELPDGTSIYGRDFDALAEWLAVQGPIDEASYEAWCREQEGRVNE